MASPFSRTVRSLSADGPGRWAVWLVPAVLLLAAWTAWFLTARVAVYAVTDRALLAAEGEAHPVEAPVDGRIAVLHLALGREVHAGDLLVELEAGEQLFREEEEQARRGALAGEVAALRRQVASAREALEQGRQGAVAARAEAAARLAEAAAAARLAEEQARRQARLLADGLTPEERADQARSEAEQRRAAAEAARLALARLDHAERTAEGERRARLEEAERELAAALGAAAGSGAAAGRLARDVELRRLRAPVAGRIGEVAPVRVGSFVEEGDRLAAVVPAGGGLKVVAEFPPAEAAGRIRPGQRALLRLAGFPSTQYGAVPATVARVANEVRGGTLRVELAPGAAPRLLPPLQHGLPGSVEVEIERVTPAALVLRAAGRLVDRPPGAPTPEQTPDRAPAPASAT